MKIILSYISPSNNQLLRMHHMKRHGLQESLDWMVFVANRRSGENGNLRYEEIIPPLDDNQKVKRKVKIISYRKRKLDRDNFLGGLKILIDSLHHNRLIYDDSDEYLDLEAEQKIDSKCPRTEIIIS